ALAASKLASITEQHISYRNQDANYSILAATPCLERLELPYLPVFHVEPGQFSLPGFKRGRDLGTTHKNLCTGRLQQLQYSSLVVAVQFRRQIIQRHDWPFAALHGVILGL